MGLKSFAKQKLLRSREERILNAAWGPKINVVRSVGVDHADVERVDALRRHIGYLRSCGCSDEDHS
jgi:hypothetical protein